MWHIYSPLSSFSTGLMDSVLFSSKKVILLLGDRGLPSFLHSLVMMEPCASQVKLTELSPAIRMPPVIARVALDIFSV